MFFATDYIFFYVFPSNPQKCLRLILLSRFEPNSDLQAGDMHQWCVSAQLLCSEPLPLQSLAKIRSFQEVISRGFHLSLNSLLFSCRKPHLKSSSFRPTDSPAALRSAAFLLALGSAPRIRW